MTSQAPKTQPTSHGHALHALIEHLGKNFTPSLRKRLPSLRAISRELGISHHALSRAANTLLERGVLLREGYRFFLTRSPVEAPHAEIIHIVTLVAGIEPWLREAPHGGQREFRTHFLPDPSSGLGFCVDILEGRHGPCGGLIVWPPSFVPDALIARYLERDIPVVACSAPSVCTSVQIDRLRIGATILQHLYQLGHREVVTLALPGRNRRRKEQIAAFEYASRYPLEPDLEVHLAVSAGENEREIAEAIQNLFEAHPEAGALVVPTARCYAPAIEVLTKRGVGISQEVSLAVIDMEDPVPGGEEVITMENSDREILHVAITLLGEAMDSLQKFGVMPRRREVYVTPEVQTRGASDPGEGFAAPRLTKIAGGEEFNRFDSLAGSLWDRPREERVAAAQRVGQARHQHTVNRAPHAFEMIELREHFNRCFRHARGWMGNIRFQLPAGVLNAHGAPFKIGGTDHGSEPCVVMLASRNVRHGASEDLPALVEIPIRRHARQQRCRLLWSRRQFLGKHRHPLPPPHPRAPCRRRRNGHRPL